IGSGFVQATFAFVTRRVTRRLLMGLGGLLFGFGFAAQGAAPSFGLFALTNVVSRIGGSPQHPVGNGLLAEQFPPERRGFAISAHISGGNVGTVIVAVFGPLLLAAVGWLGVSGIFGIPSAVIRLVNLRLVPESGCRRAHSVGECCAREACLLYI